MALVLSIRVTLDDPQRSFASIREEPGMMGWRARLGFLVPPGNPTVEPEMMQLAPQGVSVHFSRLVASGPTGTPEGQEERQRSYLHHIDQSTALLPWSSRRSSSWRIRPRVMP